MSSAGDVNGDGLDDLIIGAYRDDPHGNSSGVAFVVYGKSDGTLVELSDVEAGTGGFAIHGGAAYDYAGISVSNAGDVNGDGFSDLVVGAFEDAPNGNDSGAAFVVYGKGDNLLVELSEVEAGTGGFVINGASADDEAGRSVSSAGDVNGDGLGDLIVGVDLDDPNSPNSGAAFVVYGKSDGTVIELSDVEAGAGGFVIHGVSGDDRAGSSVSSAGDVNGDGLDDLIVGARKDDPHGANSGAAFVVYSKSDGTTVELSDIEAVVGGFSIHGAALNDLAGRSVSDAGDVNGDGLDDLLVGAQKDDPNGSNSGAAFLVYGKSDSMTVELSDIEAGTGGFAIHGVLAGDNAGVSVSNAGDVNGDGLDDLIIGAYYDSPNGNDSGTAFVVYGKTDGTAIELSDVELGTGGYVINGISAFDREGRSVSGAGDVNGDGLDDLLVGASNDDPHGGDSGAAFVVYGSRESGSNVVLGTSGTDTLTGSAAVDQLVGAAGDDTLVGNGGADVLRGGSGNDILVVSSASYLNVDGGTGTDTLRLDAPVSLDFTNLADNKTTGIEKIDLANDGGNSTIKLNVTDVLVLSETTNTLDVTGTPGDVVNLSNTTNGVLGAWSLQTDGVGTDTYVYMSGGDVLATMIVDDAITINLVV